LLQRFLRLWALTVFFWLKLPPLALAELPPPFILPVQKLIVKVLPPPHLAAGRLILKLLHFNASDG
jgi:hypothetical protein